MTKTEAATLKAIAAILRKIAATATTVTSETDEHYASHYA